MRVSLPFLGADLSATTSTQWTHLPPQYKSCAIGIGNTATGAPAGQYSIEVSNHGLAGVAGAPYTATAIPATSGACALLLDRIQTAAEFIRLVWTRTSGGTGAVFTDDSGVAGSTPSLVFKE